MLARYTAGEGRQGAHLGEGSRSVWVEHELHGLEPRPPEGLLPQLKLLL